MPTTRSGVRLWKAKNVATSETSLYRRVRRVIVGGVVGLIVGYVIALLIYGFDVGNAFVAWLWLLPAMLGVSMFAVWREMKQRSEE